MILRGPFGSGKTHTVLRAVEEAVRAGRDETVRLIVPTSSMARHLQHELARGGCAVRGGTVQTLQAVVEELTPGRVTVPAHVLEWAIERAIADAGVSWDTPGLIRRAVETMQEVWSSGTDALGLRSFARRAAQKELVRVMERVESLLAEWEFVPGPQRTALAARRLRSGALAGLDQILFDGFVNLRPVEREFVAAAHEVARRVVLTWPESASLPFRNVEVRTLETVRRALQQPAVLRVATPEAEVLEVAAAIVSEQRRSTRPWREFGVILRHSRAYAPAFEAAFRRLEVPCRTAGAAVLTEHPWARQQLRWLRQFIAGWDERSRARWLQGPLLANCGERETLAARADQEAATLGDLRGARQPVEFWREAAMRIHGITAPGDTAPTTSTAREATALRRAWVDAADRAAGFAELRNGGAMRFVEYVDALEACLRHAPTPAHEDRRDVVHLLNVYESRQWELPVVYLCGLTDGEFPQRAAQNVFFPDTERERLREQGVDLVTAAERTRDERFLFDSAISRATEAVTITVPAHDADGRPNLPSPFVAGLAVQVLDDVPVIAEGLADTASAEHRIASQDGLQRINRRHIQFAPTGIESYLQCPFQFFAARTLDLEPAEPVERQLPDGRWTGEVVHAAVASWIGDPEQRMGAVLERAFAQSCARDGRPIDFRMIGLREALRGDLERFAAEWNEWRISAEAPAGQEQAFTASVDTSDPDAYTLRGRVDLWELLSDGAAVVTDFKYATKDSLGAQFAEYREGARVQLGLYLYGLRESRGIEVAGARLLGLKRQISERGWMPAPGSKSSVAVGEDELREIIEAARDSARGAIAGVRDGDISVDPRDRSVCARYCSYRELCRIGCP